MADLLRRPEFTYDAISPIDKQRPCLTDKEKKSVETEIKYEGYIKKELAKAEKFKKLEGKKIPQNIDYGSIIGIRQETQQKLEKYKPQNIGQASRISGISPADISVLMLYIDKFSKQDKKG